MDTTLPPRVSEGSPTGMPLPIQPNRSPEVARLAFSVNEAAQMLGVSDKTVRRLIDRKLCVASVSVRSPQKG